MAIFGKSPPSPPAGVRVPRRQRAVLDVVRQLSQIGGGRGVVWSPSGPQIMPEGTKIRIGQSSGPIPARTGSSLGSGTVNEYSITATSPTAASITAMGSSFTVFNYSNTDIKTGKYVVVALLWNLWIIISAEC